MGTLGRRWAATEDIRKQKQNEYLKKQLKNTRVLRIRIDLKDRFENIRSIFSAKLGRKYSINEMMEYLLDEYNSSSKY